MITNVRSPRSAPARQTSLREHNLALVLGELADRGPASRARLAATTGLTKATVSRLVETLTEAGLVTELGRVSEPARGDRRHAGAPVGRPGVAVGLSPEGPLGVGIEINVDYLAGCAVDLTGTVRHRELVVEDQRGSDLAAVLDRTAGVLGRVLDRAAADGRAVAGVCVAVPGLVEAPAGREPLLRLAPNLAWRDVPVLDELRRRLRSGAAGKGADFGRLRMTMDNEANLAALGELWGGGHTVDGVPPRSFVHVSGEIGVGAGIVLDGRLFRGRRGFSGEIGHLPVRHDGPRCACGANGCLERLAGQEAILRGAGLALEPSTAIGSPAGSVAELVAQMSAAAGRPVAPDDLADITVLIDALYELETHLDQLDLTGVEPELKWDARWEVTE